MNPKTKSGPIIFFIALALLIIGCSPKTDDESKFTGDLFAENIRSTDARTAEEERLGFKLPPGFEIQLFASEPDIDKPINMTFDAKGRMWVTQSFEYPFPSPVGAKSTDRLTILEDTDHDGKADKFIQVTDTLNIPIGIIPVTDGAIAFSVPNVYKFSDSNADGKPEQLSKMFGPFGFQDTHGMVSNFIRGYDGWVYVCHGFTNLSTIAGSDGDSIKLASGNTFRFRLDGSRVEQMTFGQVNPFGLAYDENGYIYSTDSHSSPLYQLIRGGDYPHFGKLEIMAFGPDMKSLENEGTALCGIAYYGDTKFPKEFQGNLFIGDALLSRVHRYTWANTGSSPIGKSETDFIKSADPWFHPVNIKLGPDGALYVADFYNAIIGHYEVPLGHPKRDKQRGRIWRITYKGQHNDVKDLTTSTTDELLNALDADNITHRMAATDQLTDRIGEPAIDYLNAVIDDHEASPSPRKYIHSLWALHRLNGLDEVKLKQSIEHSSPLVRLHALRVLRESNLPKAAFQSSIQNALKDTDAHVQRAATELMINFKDINCIESILAVLKSTQSNDSHLIYTGRLILRNLLRDNALMKQVGSKQWNEQDAGFIAGTLVDVDSPDAAVFLANYVSQFQIPKDKTQLAYQQIIRFIPEAQLNSVIQKTKTKKTDIDLSALSLRGIVDGYAQRGSKPNNKEIETWGVEIAEGLLKKYPMDFKPATEDVTALQSYAFQLAGDFKAKSVEPMAASFLEKSTNTDLKTAALRSLLKMATDNRSIELAGKILMSDTTPMDFRKRVASTLGEAPGTISNNILKGVVKAPADLEAVVATALASSIEGKEIVFEQVRNGSFMARTLSDPRVEEKILFNISPQQQKTYNELIANVEPINADRQTLIDARLKGFKAFKASGIQLDSGSTIFSNNCGVCHRKIVLSGIGPQLHGIGKRGSDALAEKIIDPNRNISEAFRNYTITMKDGKVLTGLFRREQGAMMVFGDLNGKEFSIPKKDIAKQTPSRYTIMPDHFGTTLSQQEFNLLLTYLLTW